MSGDDYWMSTKTPNQAFRPSYQTAENDKFLRETAGVDPAMLVQDLDMSTFQIKAYQRQIGVRPLSNPRSPKG